MLIVAPIDGSSLGEVLAQAKEKGTLNVVSGQTDLESCSILSWKVTTAQARMDNLLSAYYSDGSYPQMVLCASDELSLGVINSLDAAGCPAENWPVITGQDCSIAIVKNLIAGKLAMSVFKDTRILAAKVVEMVDCYLLGDDVPVNDTTTYDNGVKVLPSYLCDPTYADIGNYEELLLSSGYYTADQLQ